jgi:hypothetical protein
MINPSFLSTSCNAQVLTATPSYEAARRFVSDIGTDLAEKADTPCTKTTKTPLSQPSS